MLGYLLFQPPVTFLPNNMDINMDININITININIDKPRWEGVRRGWTLIRPRVIFIFTTTRTRLRQLIPPQHASTSSPLHESRRARKRRRITSHVILPIRDISPLPFPPHYSQYGGGASEGTVGCLMGIRAAASPWVSEDDGVDAAAAAPALIWLTLASILLKYSWMKDSLGRTIS